MDVQIGVINPYALGELITGKNIKWNSVPDPQKMLSKILNIKESEIFDIRNPILNPNIQVKKDGKVEVLNQDKAKKRVNKFFKDRSARSPNQETGILSRALRLSKPIYNKLPKMFYSSAISVSESSRPWKPTDKEWIDKGDYFEDVAEVNDPIQGALGDCYFIAALSSVAWARPYIIINMIRPSSWNDDDHPIHRVNFYKNGTQDSVEVSEHVPVTKSSHSWIYARSFDSTEIWPAVMEKAFAKWRTGNTTDYPNYPAISGGDPVAACAQLTGGARKYKSNSKTSAEDLWHFIASNSVGRRTVNPMVAWTYHSQPSGTDYSSARIVASHAYSVIGWDYFNSEKYVVLRNPWGTHHGTLDTRAGTWHAHQESYWAPIPLNSNGIFSMKVKTYKKYFAGTGATV